MTVDLVMTIWKKLSAPHLYLATYKGKMYSSVVFIYSVIVEEVLLSKTDFFSTPSIIYIYYITSHSDFARLSMSQFE